MATFLVTGAAGFIGSHLVGGLIREGHEVRGLDDLSTGRRENLRSASALRFVEGDLLTADLDSLLDGVDCVLHHAAIASVPRSLAEPERTHAVNATGTVRLLDACRRHRVRRLVLASSSAVYGEGGPEARREDHPVAPLVPYSASKLAAEAYCRAFSASLGVSTVCLRYFNVFGPRQDPDSPYAAAIPRFLGLMARGQPPVVFGDGLQTRDFVYVDDVVAANLAAATAPGVDGAVLNIGSGQAVTVLELVAAINEVLGTRLVPVHDPVRPGDIRHSWTEIAKAGESIGYRPRIGLAEGLARTLPSVLERT